MSRFILLLLLLVSISCSKKNTAPKHPEPGPYSNATLAGISSDDFPIGMSAGIDLVEKNATVSNIVSNQCDRYSSTAFFWAGFLANEGSYNYNASDRALSYAQKNGKKIHGHCLVYANPSISPEWLVNYPGTNAEFEALIHDYLTTVTAKYKGKVHSYDVANEIFNYYSNGANPTWLRNRYTSDEAFFDFIGNCYKWVHEADPDALLFYNDYGQEYTYHNHEKMNAIISQVNAWKANGVHIDGLGIQLHTNIYRPMQDIEYALREIVKTGLLIHISELDVSVNWIDVDQAGSGVQQVASLSDAMARQQQDMYKNIVKAYNTIVPAAQQYGITLWDPSDADTWIQYQRKDWPCVFDTNRKKKPAFWGMLSGLAGFDIAPQ